MLQAFWESCARFVQHNLMLCFLREKVEVRDSAQNFLFQMIQRIWFQPWYITCPTNWIIFSNSGQCISESLVEFAVVPLHKCWNVGGRDHTMLGTCLQTMNYKFLCQKFVLILHYPLAQNHLQFYKQILFGSTHIHAPPHV